MILPLRLSTAPLCICLPELCLDCRKLLYDSMTERDRTQKLAVISQPAFVQWFTSINDSMPEI